MILYCSVLGQEDTLWRPLFEKALPGIDFRSPDNWGDMTDEPAIAFVWGSPHGLLAKYKNIQTIFSAGAGIDHLTADPDLPSNVPIVRMSDTSLREGMAEYAVMATLWFHRMMPKAIQQQKKKSWKTLYARAACDYTVGIMGYGNLGRFSAEAIKPFGYKIHTWSNTPKQSEEGVKHFYGQDELHAFLSSADVVIAILPHTAETTHLINAETLSYMKKGAAIVNAGRGNLIDLDALISSVNSGHLSGAMLDVFDIEPLPEEHPIRGVDNIIITPHIAAVTRPETSVKFVRIGAISPA